MKRNMMTSIWWGMAAWVVSTSLAASAVTVVDSFDSGSLFLSLDGVSGKALAVETPFGLTRSATLDTRRAPAGSVITATFDSSAGGSLSFFADRTASGEASGALVMSMSYWKGGPYSLDGFSAFEFDFGDVIGSGFLVVEVGSAAAILGPSFHRLTIDQAGVLTVPFDQLNVTDSSASLDFFHSLHFTFESDSDIFSFTLNEIRAVPEPSSALLALVGMGALMRRRRSVKR
jgi:hypothetical protein